MTRQRVYFISDTHFNHANILKFFNKDGSLVRSFSSVEEMNEVMIENWNKTIRPEDKVYHLGDLVMGTRTTDLDSIMSRLNGKKILIKGNHDDMKASAYLTHFKDIRSTCVVDHMMLSHIPVYRGEYVPGKFNMNIHGHLHCAKVLKSDGSEDPFYFNVSVECINYTPISLEEVQEELKKRGSFE